MKALVIDGNETNRYSLARDVAKLGYDVCEAGNGVSGLACYLDNFRETALVLVELDVPRQNGLSVIRGVRHIAAEYDVNPTICLMCARSSTDAIRQAYRLGANHVFTEPYDRAALKTVFLKVRSEIAA